MQRKKKVPLLKRVALQTQVSYGYARRVSCGLEKNNRVMQVIIGLKQKEVDKLRASITEEATTDFK